MSKWGKRIIRKKRTIYLVANIDTIDAANNGGVDLLSPDNDDKIMLMLMLYGLLIHDTLIPAAKHNVAIGTGVLYPVIVYKL